MHVGAEHGAGTTVRRVYGVGTDPVPVGQRGVRRLGRGGREGGAGAGAVGVRGTGTRGGGYDGRGESGGTGA